MRATSCGPAAGRVQGLVEPPVVGQERGPVVDLARAGHSRELRAHRPDARGGDLARPMTSRETLERGADREQLLDVLDRQAGNGCPPAWLDGHESLRLEDADRFPDRHHAHVHLARDLAQPERRARWQLAGQDQLPKLAGHRLRDGRVSLG